LLAVPFAVLVVLVRERSGVLLSADRDVATSLNTVARQHPAFATTMRVISDVVSPLGWWIVLVPVFVWLVYRRLRRLAGFLAVTALGSWLLNAIVKSAVHRARPHVQTSVATAHGLSFPSGHTQAATVCCGVLILIFTPIVPRARRAWLYVGGALVVALVGFSRIALGVHYLSDVLGGIVIGVAWLLAMTAAFSAWRQEERRPAVDIGEGLEPEQRSRLQPGPPTSPPE
jgi:undecaprenyl-diphosphatase